MFVCSVVPVQFTVFFQTTPLMLEVQVCSLCGAAGAACRFYYGLRLYCKVVCSVVLIVFFLAAPLVKRYKFVCSVLLVQLAAVYQTVPLKLKEELFCSVAPVQLVVVFQTAPLVLAVLVFRSVVLLVELAVSGTN